jgi:hypothetical protein
MTVGEGRRTIADQSVAQMGGRTSWSCSGGSGPKPTGRTDGGPGGAGAGFPGRTPGHLSWR